MPRLSLGSRTMANLRRGSVLMVFLGLAAGAPTAEAAVKDCNPRVVAQNQLLFNAGVSSVRNMSCKKARRAIRRNGQRQSNAPYGGPGSRFRLGPWRCSVYYHNYELWKARCTRGGRAFRVDYGV